MRIVPRADWGARPPTSVAWMAMPVEYTFLHHTADEHLGTGAQWVQAEQNYHMDVQGWSDIGYSWLYDARDKTFYEGRGWGVAGAHTYGFNSQGHALCLLGNFEGRTLDAADLAELAAFLRLARDGGHGPAAFSAHCSMPDNETACPGRNALARIPEINDMVDQAPAPATGWAALTNNDTDFGMARDTVHLRLGVPILGAADAGKAKGALYVGAFDAPARPWEKHLQTQQATGQGADRTREQLDWWVRAVQAVGFPPL